MAQDYRQLLGADLLSDSRGYLNNSDEALRTLFSGATAPTSPVAYQLWVDTANGYLKQRNAANNAWVVIGILGSDYFGCLPRSGGTMTGAIDAGGFALSNLGLGTGLAAARVQEVDLKAPLAGPVFTGDAKVSQDPAGNDSIPRRSWTEGRYLKLAGGTMTGAIVLSGDASAVLHPVSLQQLKTFVLFNTTTGHRHSGTDARKVLGSNLDSAATAAGKTMVADGSGGTSWASLVTMIEEVSLGSFNHPVVAQDVDLSASVPAGCVAALLTAKVKDSAKLWIRPGGWLTSWWQTFDIPNSGGDGFVFLNLTVPLSTSRTFNFQVTLGSSGSTTFWLVGYVRGA